MWRNPFKRREAESDRWTERDIALENAPWTPLSDLDDRDFGRDAAPQRYYDRTRYHSGWRRFVPERARGRGKVWWGSRIFAAILLIFFVLVAWLAITAPLSKSLEPIAPPQITLLAADGTPIARNGAVVEEPVEIADLPDHVVQPFLAIEDRRFYDHWGVDPRGVCLLYTSPSPRD